MEQETITRRGGEVIITPVEELPAYEMANIQINTDERQSIVIQNKDGWDIMTLYCVNGAVDRAIIWGVGGQDIGQISWFTNGETIAKEIDRENMGNHAVTYLTRRTKNE